MCGINGYLGFNQKEEARRVIGSMNRAVAHRGPDDEGNFVDEQAALGHQRLSILDLSSAGHQPMKSNDGRYAIVFNGEIYNFRELKRALPHYPYQSESDTEMILAAYKKWGKRCVRKFNGMFAFAVWDTQEKSLFIARDRLGIKPLYYFKNGSLFLFSSEIRALLKSRKVPKQINKPAVSDFLQYQTVHAPQTIVENVNMLLPGHCMTYCNGNLDVEKYWNPADYIESGNNHESPGGYDAVKKRVRNLLYESVERRLIADVPVGAFLSGGIDSSAIVGLMSEIIPGNVRTFSVTFEESKFNESKFSSLVAKRFKTDHTEIRLTPDDFLEMLPDALQSMDHPSGDGPNTYVVSKETRNAGVTVALSGLGGDEIFAGYPIFAQSLKLQDYRWISGVPRGVRDAAGQLMNMVSGRRSVSKIASLISEENFELHHSYPLSRQIYAPSEIEKIIQHHKNGANPVRLLADELSPMFGTGRLISKISAAEIQTYMQNILLRDTDQMSMASGLEVRVPFLDHLLVEELLSLTDVHKIPVSPKKLLTDSLGSMLPTEVVHRKKMGFDFPWEYWLKNELREKVEHNLRALKEQEFINAAEIEYLQQRFFTNSKQIIWPKIWLLFILQEWMDHNGFEM